MPCTDHLHWHYWSWKVNVGFLGTLHEAVIICFAILLPLDYLEILWRVAMGVASVCSGCCNKIPQTGWLKQQKFISHISGHWKVQDQGTSWCFASFGEALFLACRWWLLTASSHGRERERESKSWCPFFSFTKTCIRQGSPEKHNHVNYLLIIRNGLMQLQRLTSPDLQSAGCRPRGAKGLVSIQTLAGSSARKCDACILVQSKEEPMSSSRQSGRMSSPLLAEGSTFWFYSGPQLIRGATHPH